MNLGKKTMTNLDELLARLDKFPSFYSMDGSHWYQSGKVDETCKQAATTIRSLRAELEAVQEKYRLLSAQHARLCDEVYEEDGETLKIVAERKNKKEFERDWLEACDQVLAERKAREEAERESKESEQLRFEENRRCCAEMDKRLAAESRLATVRAEVIEECAKVCYDDATGIECAEAIRALANETAAASNGRGNTQACEAEQSVSASAAATDAQYLRDLETGLAKVIVESPTELERLVGERAGRLGK